VPAKGAHDDATEDDYLPPQVIQAPDQAASPPPDDTMPPPPPSSEAQPSPAPATTPKSRPGVISAAPVRYEKSIAAEEFAEDAPQGGLGSGQQADETQLTEDGQEDDQDEEAPRSNRPGQKNFAKRLLQKYGWEEGKGLGASATGITTPLRHQTQKRKKRSDAEGGGWTNPAAMGKIVGGKRQKTDDDDDDADELTWSIVAQFKGMVDGLDLDYEISEENLMQRIGDKVGEYGVVERLYIDRRDTEKRAVFVKFTSALSAYRVSLHPRSEIIRY